MKKASYTPLLTEYVSEMDGDCPHAYYPRPQFKRDSYLCLNGKWSLTITDKKNNIQYKGDITLPFCPESILSGVGRITRPGDRLTYTKRFRLPEGFMKDRLILHVGAADSCAELLLNGKAAAKNDDGYLPFSADITDLTVDGENEITVIVTDSLDKLHPRGKQKYKRGGMWYTPVSGIWQTVWLESVPKDYIKSLKITPRDGSVTIRAEGGTDRKTLMLATGEIYEFCGNEITVDMTDGRLWTPEEPYLYYFTLSSGRDTVESYFAYRFIDVRSVGNKKRLCLNGKPYIFNGLLDQGYYPDGLFLPATEMGYEEDILRAKALGFNTLRKHIKVEPMIFYYLCDKLGMVVFQDMVNNGNYSFLLDTALPTVGLQRLPDRFKNANEKRRSAFRKHTRGLIELLYNSPSVLYYTVFNEGWGQFCADEMYDEVKALDPTRIIDSTSGWFRRKRSDVDSRHVYFKALSAKKPSGDPLVISEFGGYSHRVSGHVYGRDNYGYRLFENREDFEDALVKLYEDEVIPMATEGCSAFIYTQISDVEDETNGLITYDRRVVKASPERLSAVMARLYKTAED